jgi:hypothetical protein
VCICLEWIDLLHIRIGGESVWLQQWTVRFGERWRSAWMADGRFASRVGQTALGYTELRRRCVQEQSNRSVKLSTNLLLIPRLRSCRTYCHFPIRFHTENFKMSFPTIFVRKTFFFLERGATYCGRWTRKIWICPPPSFCGCFCNLRAETVGTSETRCPYTAVHLPTDHTLDSQWCNDLNSQSVPFVLL